MPLLRGRAQTRAAVRTLRRLASLAGAAALLLSLWPGTAAAAPTGVIRGRVVNGATGRPQAGVRVELLGGRNDESGGFEQDVSETTTTGRDGRYEFAPLHAGRGRVYTLDALFEGGMFTGGAVGLRAGDVLDTDMRVWSTTTDPSVIVIQRNDVFVVRGDNGVSVIESYKVVNIGDEAYIGRGGGEADADEPVATLSFPIPPEATDIQVLDSDLDIPQLIETSTGIGITTAIPPTARGDTGITFIYGLPQQTGQVELSRRALYPTLNFDVLAEPPFVVEGNRLSEAGTRSISDVEYRVYESDDTIEAGDPIQVVARAEGSGETTLVVGAVAAGIVVLALVGFGLVRRRRAATPPPGRRSEQRTREELLEEIARLDLRYDDGELDEGAYEEERATLKRRLRAQEPAS